MVREALVGEGKRRRGVKGKDEEGKRKRERRGERGEVSSKES